MNPATSTCLENKRPQVASLESNDPVPKCLPLDTVRRNRTQEVRICILAARAWSRVPFYGRWFRKATGLTSSAEVVQLLGEVFGFFHCYSMAGEVFPCLNFKNHLWMDAGGSKLSEAYIQTWKTAIEKTSWISKMKINHWVKRLSYRVCQRQKAQLSPCWTAQGL